MCDIARRIRNMVVAMPYGLETMLGLLDIVETEEVKTACVPIGGVPRILINPSFVEKECDTDEKLFMLIMHELHHVLLGHTRLFQRISLQHNIAFDAIINAMLCRSNPKPDWMALFCDYYAPTVYPFCLLRPPKGFPRQAEYPAGMPEKIQSLIQTLYYSNRGTFLEVFELIQEFDRQLAKNKTLLGGLTQVGSSEVEDGLLGEHGEDEKGWELEDDPALFEVIRAVVEKWPQPKQPIRGRSLNDILSEVTVLSAPPPTPHQVIRRAIWSAAKHSGERGGKHLHYEQQRLQQFWPSRDRRGFAQSLSGGLIPIYQEELPKRKHSREKVAVYIDVSGSMAGYRAAVISAVLSCKGELDTELYLFSTQIVPTSVEVLRAGKIQTTGGTTSDCVFEHIEENKLRAVVLLTDGYVGKPDPKYHKLLRFINLQTVLTPNGFPEDLRAASRNIHQLT